MPISAARSNRSRSAALPHYDLPFSTWSLTKLTEHLVAKGVVNDTSHEGLRLLTSRSGRAVPSSPSSAATCEPCTHRPIGSRSCSITPHLSTKRDRRGDEWAASNNVELA